MKKKMLLFLACMLTGMSAMAELTKNAKGFYELGTAQDVVDFSALVNTGGEQGANAVLTADIDMTGINFTPIGIHYDEDAPAGIAGDYRGTFDGAGHVIKNLYIERTDKGEAGFIGRTTDAVIKNLGIVNATIKQETVASFGSIRAGVIAAIILRGRVENCFTAGNLTITNGTGAKGYLVATFLQNFGGSGQPMVSCFTTGEKIAGEKDGTMTNCFAGADVEAKGPTGELCYLLNGKSSEDPVWFQELDVDDYPTFDSTKGIVYMATDQDCAGNPKGEATYSNLPGQRDDHEFVDGLCKNCDETQENYVTEKDGVFQIANGKQLAWFAHYVNQVSNTASAVLLADIDMTGVEKMQPIGLFADESYRNQFGLMENSYKGQFDGQGHEIKNLKIVMDNYYEAGLFSRVTDGVIRNLGIENASITNTKGIRAGVLAGELQNAKVFNVYTIGTIEINTSHAQKGGLAGEASGANIFNSYTTYDKLVAALGAKYDCFEGEQARAMAPTGELCFKLNTDQKEIIYYQNLGEGGDSYPVLLKSHKQVYAAGDVRCDGEITGDATFSNTATESTLPEHQYDNVGICSVCGADIGYVKRASDMWLEVATGEQLRYAMRLCNYKNEQGNKDRGLCFRLTADIDMTGIEGMEPFGLFADTEFQTQYGLMDNAYVGQFDGQGHEIKNLKIVMDNYYETGLFSRINGGQVRNLGIVNAYIENTKGIRAGVIAGEMIGTLTNVYTIGEIEVKTDHAQKGGIAAECYNGTLNNCYTTYEKLRTQHGTLNNCYEGADAAAWAPTGELTYKLNAGKTENPTWFQTLGTEDHPRLIGKDIVYSIEGFGYSNYNLDMARPQLVDGVYQITNGKELVGFAAMVNEASGEYTNANAIVMNNIDMTGLEYIAIGEKNAYTGEFDGNGNTIDSLAMENPAGPCALFGYVGAGAFIHNLTIGDACSFTARDKTAALISFVKGEEEGTLTLEDIVNYASVKGNNRVGGVIAHAECAADAPLTIEMNNVQNYGAISGAQQVAGVLAYSKVDKVNILNCFNGGEITSTQYHVGGIVGRTEKGTDTAELIIKNSTNEGNVTADRTSVGGICGVALTANTVENCINKGTIQGSGCVGGIMGNSAANASGCANFGHIIGTAAYGELKIGGIFGNAGSEFKLTDSFNEGKIEGQKGTMDDSNKANGNAGGVVGVATTKFTVFNCYNEGEVIGMGNNCGGVVGRLSSGSEFTIKNSWNTGNVSSEIGENAGGIIGGAQGSPTPHIINCYNTGKIAGNSNSAAIAGWLGNNNPAEVKNCWNIGELVNNGGNNTMYRRGGSGTFTRLNNYDLSGTVEAPATATPPSDYTAEWLENGHFTYYINQGAGEFVYRQNIGDDAHPVLDAEKAYVGAVSESGFGTFYVADEAVTVDPAIKAYTGMIEGDKLMLEEIPEGLIPMSTAVVLHGEPGYYNLTSEGEIQSPMNNDLQGTAEPLVANGTQYVLAEVEGKAGFYKANAESTIPFAKGYLVIADGDVKSLSIVFGDATGIAEVETENAEKATIYDVAGRRVEKAVKGIYIINGKKVLK